MTPNIIIFRIPDVDGSKTFIQVPIDALSIHFNQAQEFQVLDGDSYNLLEFSEIVLAVASDGGESSIELARVQINEIGGAPAVIHSDPIQLASIVGEMLEEWEQLNAAAE